MPRLQKIIEGMINYLAVGKFKDDFLEKMTCELNFQDE